MVVLIKKAPLNANKYTLGSKWLIINTDDKNAKQIRICSMQKMIHRGARFLNNLVAIYIF
jgi:hypothetical protein